MLKNILFFIDSVSLWRIEKGNNKILARISIFCILEVLQTSQTLTMYFRHLYLLEFDNENYLGILDSCTKNDCNALFFDLVNYIS